MLKKKPGTIDEYIAGFPAEVQDLLQQVRETVVKAAPAASEAIKYGMPAYVLKGNLVFFAGYKNHIGFYPAPVNEPSFKKELAGYKTGRGSVQFPLDKPLPLALIKRIVKHRIKQQAVKK